MAAREPTFNDMFTRQGLVLKNGGLSLSANGYVKGGQTSYNVGSGFFLGYSGGAYKFSLGNPSGDHITWDGSNLTVSGGIVVDYIDIIGTKPPSNADHTQTAVNATVTITGGGITLSGGGVIKAGKTTYASTTSGFYLGYDSTTYKFHIGDATSYFKWTGSAIELVGNISGTSTIDITGVAYFSGQTPGVGGVSTALYGNYALDSVTGVLGKSDATLASHAATGIGVHGYGAGTEASGVVGVSDNRMGVSGLSNGNGASAMGVRAYCSGTGYGLWAQSVSGYSIYCNGTSYFNSTMTVNGGVTATTFTGALSGNATTATTAAACSGNAATATSATYANRSGEVYNSGNCSMYAGSATYQLMLQASDGNPVVYDAGMNVIWSGQYGWVSDRNKKTGIKPTTQSGLDTINALQIRDFRWNNGLPQDDGKEHTDVIAQELAEILPTAVGNVGGTMMIDKGAIVPFLVKAVQELSEQVKAMQIEIQALKSK
jgi:hypothetical protein